MNLYSEKLITWYKKNRRDLPWRKTNDPYLIWISEIVLQQTRVDQGMNYYLRFVKRFPDVHTLASASEQEVLNLWQGLGYYSRARNLHHAAKEIVEKYKGHFPGNYDEIIGLKGIGQYTAAAILSIAFEKHFPVVDGNVIRVISRLYGISTPMNTGKGKKEVLGIAETLIAGTHPGTFNQAIMEFGALFCKPQNPDCSRCIFRTECKANLLAKVTEWPVSGKKMLPRDRFFNYIVFYFIKSKAVNILIRKREQQDIWKNLYDFYLIEGDHLLSDKEIHEVKIAIPGAEFLSSSKPFKHQLTHQTIHAKFFIYKIDILSKQKNQSELQVVNLDELEQFPMPRLIEKYIDNQPFKNFV